jgi:glutamyl-Q tRNA(Asp) synthetase
MDAYREALEILRDRDLVFPCSCTRSQLGPGGNCGGRCRPAPGDPVAQRLRVVAGLPGFTDCFLGPQPPQPGAQDLVLWRKDDLPAYQLAVSVDDGEDSISDVVRGVDLLETTAAQHLIISALGKTPPRYAHLPLLCDPQGRKLSKQNGAPPLDLSDPLANLQRALERLGQGVRAEPGDCVKRLLERAVSRWNSDAAIAAAGSAGSELRWQEAPRETVAS